MREGTARLLAVVDKLGDEDLRGPSTLPGWSRAHVIGHLARNAEALVRLATWAQTGIETPMYADREQRAAEIERSAALPADTLRAQLTDTAAALDTALTRLTAAQWEAEVRSALGRAIPAAELPWMRIREVWLHAVDLNTGARMDDLPDRGGRPAPRRRHHGPVRQGRLPRSSTHPDRPRPDLAARWTGHRDGVRNRRRSRGLVDRPDHRAPPTPTAALALSTTVPDERQSMSDITLESTTSADGTTIGYLRRGTGPALVITHGSVSASEQWLPATEHLAQHFTCYVHDRRGRGRSGDATAYDLSTEVADIAALMAVAGPGAHLLGHSYGALCALAYAETHALDGTLLLFEPPLAVDGPVAGAALAAYRDLVAAGDLEGAFEFALAQLRPRASRCRPGDPKDADLGHLRPADPDLGPGVGADRRARRGPQALRARSPRPPTSSRAPPPHRSCTSRPTPSSR